jgi:DNA modification methylase
MTYINEGFNMTVQNDDLVSLEKTVQVKKLKLNISHDRTCDCKPNHINCLTPKEWVKAQVAIWSFNYEKRDIRDKHIHPAVFPIGLPKKCIELFTHKGALRYLLLKILDETQLDLI